VRNALAWAIPPQQICFQASGDSRSAALNYSKSRQVCLQLQALCTPTTAIPPHRTGQRLTFIQLSLLKVPRPTAGLASSSRGLFSVYTWGLPSVKASLSMALWGRPSSLKVSGQKRPCTEKGGGGEEGGVQGQGSRRILGCSVCTHTFAAVFSLLDKRLLLLWKRKEAVYVSVCVCVGGGGALQHCH
jgi:hypothetical protein